MNAEPQVVARVAEFNSHSVLVGGRVNAPHRQEDRKGGGWGEGGVGCGCFCAWVQIDEQRGCRPSLTECVGLVVEN